MANKVNLDAMVPRGDLDTTMPSHARSGQARTTVALKELEKDQWFYVGLRKPDFQRETNEWEPRKVAGFIESVLNWDLIPAMILWESPNGDNYVVDGCHRLSSLIAWMNDDYGDRAISKAFYDSAIPDQQLRIADRTRKLVNKTVGPYSDYVLAATNPEKVRGDIAERAKRLGGKGLDLQWVKGDASNAERSFFKINQEAAPIDQTELRVLQARRKPLGIAARAIVRNAEGHKYWAHFSPDIQERLERLAKEVHSLLFEPPLPSGATKTTELPIGGERSSGQSLPLVLELLSLVSGTDVNSEDLDGAATVACLERCKRVIQAICSDDHGSLGLHPVVYFYSPVGRHKVASFWATTLFVQDLIARKEVDRFVDVREEFELLLRNYDYLSQQIVRGRRGGVASVKVLRDFYFALVDSLKAGNSADEAAAEVVRSKKFPQLSKVAIDDREFGPEFSTGAKSEIFLAKAMGGAPKCAECRGYLHRNAITIDHIQRKADGGLGDPQNGDLLHPYCNSGRREKKAAAAKQGR
ncbi:MAG: DUF262 domain-containing protein [Dehalococcoidia bacterium]